MSSADPNPATATTTWGAISDLLEVEAGHEVKAYGKDPQNEYGKNPQKGLIWSITWHDPQVVPFAKREGAAVLALTILVLQSPAIASWNPISAAESQLSLHWVPGWGYRDELNRSDIDYQNFWTDNAGKILTTAVTTHDTEDAYDATSFLMGNLSEESRFMTANLSVGYYLPEALINSSVPILMKDGEGLSITNGIVDLQANNDTSSALDQLAVGNNYTGFLPLAFIGGDRIWINATQGCCAYRAQSSEVFSIPGGFSKRSLFAVNGSQFYVYANATIREGEPFANVSLQLEPLDASGPQATQLFLQLFNTSSTYPFGVASSYSANGTFVGRLPSRGAVPAASAGMAIAYSDQTSVFTTDNDGTITGQDAIAISFGSHSIYDVEHWTEDVPFSHSWLGVGYDLPKVMVGAKSFPVYASVYPIEHFDYRLANETAKFIASAPDNVSVAPPVGFGFVSYGLSLLARNDSRYVSLARGYWNYYYSAYDSSDPSTAYSRSTDLLALAGFEIYGCNKTVEGFTRTFVKASPGSSIEEYGWATAALHQLYLCTQSPSDLSVYQNMISSFSSSPEHYVTLAVQGSTTPTWTFEYGEAASGLMLGGVPFNYPAVVSAMNGVYQSNVSGTVLNSPIRGDEANTETLPAYILSTWLFESEMRNETGYWITGLHGANITSISYSANVVLVQAVGNAGSYLTIANGTATYVYHIEGFGTLDLQRTPISGNNELALAAVAAAAMAAAIIEAIVIIVFVRARTADKAHSARLAESRGPRVTR